MRLTEELVSPNKVMASPLSGKLQKQTLFKNCYLILRAMNEKPIFQNYVKQFVDPVVDSLVDSLDDLLVGSLDDSLVD